ncbi:ABC transporter ATP-binding protein [Microvirga soli]|uniref:ABC transporter ATP-binding protein n=1 Tax=Microvirga soli TaxID=1854496 RepID=UPI0035E45A94
MLSVVGLEAGYAMLPVLFNVSLNVFPGEIVAVLGSNGVGKSTLINHVVGMYRPNAGRVLFEGEDITQEKADAIVGRGLIQVPEGRRIFPNLSVQENLTLGAYRRGGKNIVANIERVYRYFPKLKLRHEQLAGTLSGGEQQMLAIGRGLMSEPKMIMFDEPSLGLSPLLVAEMFELFSRLRKDGLTILLVEQNLAQSLEIADRAYVLENGRNAISGTAKDLLDSADVRKAYLGM